MRAVVTRVKHASVTIEGEVRGQIGEGYLVLLGVAPGDTEETAGKLADKICNLRVISQFTLFADTSSRRPGFSGAAKPDLAVPLYEKFMARCRERGFTVEHGEFGAKMDVDSLNHGPVTILFDTEKS